MTVDELDRVMTEAKRALDTAIVERLQTIEGQMRADVTATGEASGGPSDGSWRRVTIDEAMRLERLAMRTWREGALTQLRERLSETALPPVEVLH